MLAIVLPKQVCHELAEESESGGEFEVDLDAQVIRRPSGNPPIPFVIDPFRRHCLLNGLDDISLILDMADAISVYEQYRSATWPWLDGVGFDVASIPVSSKTTINQMDW
jgi:3-isopropylmalate dehydratase